MRAAHAHMTASLFCKTDVTSIFPFCKGRGRWKSILTLHEAKVKISTDRHTHERRTEFYTFKLEKLEKSFSGSVRR